MSLKTSARIFLIRHGETQWTVGGKHASTTEVVLSKEGERQIEEARETYVGPGKLIDPTNVARIYISPLQRTRRTAELLQLGFHTGQHFYDRETETVKASEVSHETPENLIQMTPWLHEWHYGEYEGLTRMEIESRRGAKDSWSIWTDGCPGGETPEQVTERLDCLIDEIHQVVQSTASSWPGGPTVAHATRQARDVVCIGHGHTLAALALRWADQPIRSGMRLLIEPSSVAVLCFENDDLQRPAISLGRRANR